MFKKMTEAPAILIAAIITAIAAIIAAIISRQQTFIVLADANATNTAVAAAASQAIAILQNTIEAPTITSLPTQTLYPTHTPYPTYTPVPFPTIPPTSTISLPFSDNFDNGMKSEWRVVQGQPLIVDGRLSSTGSSNEKAVLEIGDSFTNYTAEFDFELLPNSHYMGFVIGRQIRYTGTDYCCNLWESFSSGRWEYIADGAPNGSGRNGHAQVVVSGNTYSLFINGQMVSKITYGTPSSGPFAIIIDYRAFIDNLKITAN